MRYLLLTLIIATAFTLSGCSTSTTLPEKEEVYRVTHRQLPPEPTYNRLRWVHLPVTHPARNLKRHTDGERPKLMPVYHFTVSDTSMCDAAAVLAGMARYTSYCASPLKDLRISLNMLGTLPEVADRIEAEHPVNVIIDHEHKEVRFLRGKVKKPRHRFLDEEGVKGEH
jgi:hypothetical protein